VGPGSLTSVDISLFRAVNRLAIDTPWLHGVLRAYAGWVGIAVLGVVVAMAWLKGRSSANPPLAVAYAWWAVASAAIAFGLNQPIARGIDRARPYETLHRVELLVPRVHGLSFASNHAVVVGALVAALALSDRARMLIAAACGVALVFVRVYVGAQYPGDVVGGLALGAATALALRPFGMAVLRWVAIRVERSPLHWLVAAPVPDPDRVATPRPR
jgi:membrane-associated phospholipid phosphatase